jgi:lysyl-tRNA synthetase class 2
MASQQAADSVKNAVQNVTDKVKDMTTSDGPQQNLLRDDVTGERVSKTELKKRQKAREKDAKKAEREATKQAPPQPKRKAASQEEEEGKLNANVSQDIPLFVTPLRVYEDSYGSCSHSNRFIIPRYGC